MISIHVGGDSFGFTAIAAEAVALLFFPALAAEAVALFRAPRNGGGPRADRGICIDCIVRAKCD